MGFRTTWLKCENGYKCKNLLINAYLKKKKKNLPRQFLKNTLTNKFNISGVVLFLMKADTDGRQRIK